jgi:hypothetical protein
MLAYETCKDSPVRDQAPIWEFLRHTRNAAAHGGRFTFRNNEPCRPADWRSISLDAGLEGTPVMKGADGRGLLSPGDPIALLRDIEQAYPGLNAATPA